MSDNKSYQGYTSNKETQLWIEFVIKEEQELVKRIEDVSKYLTTINSLILTIIVFFINTNKIHVFNYKFLNFSFYFWIVSLLLSLIVLFPWRYAYNKDSANSIRIAYRKIVQTKLTLLVYCIFSFIIAIVLTIVGCINIPFLNLK